MVKRNIDFPKHKNSINQAILEKVVKLAIEEDLGGIGDITSESVLGSESNNKSAIIIAKDEGIICGVDIVKYVYSMIDKDLVLKINKKDGDEVKYKEVIVELNGKAKSITEGERIALNFLGMMSGIATKTRRLYKLIEGSNLRILDTRKTLPGLREFQKYAVYIGGGNNHRFGLYDMILIKDNHISACGSVSEAVKRAKSKYKDKVIEIEVSTLEQVKEALNTEADILMLDNMNNDMIIEAVRIINKEKYIEVSGNITEERLAFLSKIGVDFVSMGALTHTIKPLDLSLLIQ